MKANKQSNNNKIWHRLRVLSLVLLTLSGSQVVGGNFSDAMSNKQALEAVVNDHGVNQINNSTVTFYVNSDSWADVHYLINDTNQQNFRMNLAGDVNTKTITNLAVGDVLTYWFTYLDDQGLAFDAPQQTYTLVDLSGSDRMIGNLLPIINLLLLDETNQDSDGDGDGVSDDVDQCPNTSVGSNVDVAGCVDTDNDGIADSVDQCPNSPAGDNVDAIGCTVSLGDITPIYDKSTILEPELVYDDGNAIVTKFADRARDRHAKEDHFQAYDHYLSHYWTHRTARFKIEDYVAKAGNSLEISFVTEWPLGVKEFRAWYYGMNTVAEYHGNYEHNVKRVGSGTYDDDLNQISIIGNQHKYQLSIHEYRGLNGSVEPLATGQEMEFEVSQFLSNAPEGRANYYGTTFLYRVGVGGVVPWYTEGDFADKSSERENSHKLDESAWLGGATTLAYSYSNEPDNHFMQMATNTAPANGQNFVLGRRIHHTNFVTGEHSEPNNGIFEEMVGKSGPHYINTSCSSCHIRNGRAPMAAIGEPLDKWVFKVGDNNGKPHKLLGNVLQPNNIGLAPDQGEGGVYIASWTEKNGLRSPNYAFTNTDPETIPETFSARISPQLVGLGLLEAIKESDILANEDLNDANGDGISGKAHRVIDPVTGDTRIGRFGYKAISSSVKHHVARAFNTDIGVTSSIFPTPDCGMSQTSCGDSGNEITDDNVDKLAKYVALLGIRPQRDHTDTQVLQGKKYFNSIGCSACHISGYTTTEFHPLAELRKQNIQPYTDLLLHDMGLGLADNLGEGQATGAEWRTAPLWGLGLSACVTGGVTPNVAEGNEECTPDANYLHDGRARTIEEAILWHGGEGQAANDAYQQLPDSDKVMLLKFLNSL